MRSETVLEGPGVGSRCILRNKSTSLGWVTLPLCSCPPSALSFALCAFWNFRLHCLPDLSFWNAQVFQNGTLRDLFERKATGFVMFSLPTCSYPVAWQIFLHFSESVAVICSLTFVFLISHGDKIQCFSFMEAC